MYIYTRAPEYDRRIERGDDFSGDAWLHVRSGLYQFVGAGVEMPQEKDRAGIWYKKTEKGLERIN